MSELVLLKSLLARLETHQRGDYKYRPEDYVRSDMNEWINRMQRKGLTVYENYSVSLDDARAMNDEIDTIIECLKDGKSYPPRLDAILCDRLHKTQVSMVRNNVVSQGDLGVLLDVKKQFSEIRVRGRENGTLIDANKRLDALIEKIENGLTTIGVKSGPFDPEKRSVSIEVREYEVAKSMHDTKRFTGNWHMEFESDEGIYDFLKDPSKPVGIYSIFGMVQGKKGLNLDLTAAGVTEVSTKSILENWAQSLFSHKNSRAITIYVYRTPKPVKGFDVAYARTMKT